MNVFDIIGPVMVGPSSSHTAGAARIGKIARLLLSKTPVRADITLSGSFSRTYRGHGTDLALAAGILGMEPDDERLSRSLSLAQENGLEIHFTCQDLPDAHPNTAEVELTAADGTQVTIQGASIGGGSVSITKLNGLAVQINADSPVLVVPHKDKPGVVGAVSNLLASDEANICSLYLAREQKFGNAVMTVGVDKLPAPHIIAQIRQLEAVSACIPLCLSSEQEANDDNV